MRAPFNREAPVPPAAHDDLLRTLRTAHSVAVLTGAGISAESGVPTFRGSGGLWRGFRAEQLASPEGFARDPATVWEFYDQRRTHLASCRPNQGHEALARLERLVDDFTLITQNVDRLHQQAGSRRVIELHGDIWTVRCVAGCGEREDRTTPLPRPLPPRCSCGAPLRPGVVWFGEMLPEAAFAAAMSAAQRAELFLVVGTSGIVEPAASLARWAGAAGARVVEFNPEETALTRFTHDQFRGAAGDELPRLVADLAR